MFYKVATAFACFLVLGQAMADENNPAGANKGVTKGAIGAVDEGKAGPNVGPSEPSKGEPNVGPSEPSKGEPNVGPSEPNVGPEASKGEPNVGPSEPNVGPEPSKGEPNVGPSEPNVGPSGPNVGPNVGPNPEAGKRAGLAPITGTFDQLKLACEDPAAFHFQLPPGNILISCESQETAWVPDGAGAIDGDCSRTVTGEISSSKVIVEREQYTFAVPSNPLTCPSFKQIVRKYHSEYGTTCEELRGYDNLGQFCEERLSSDPNAIPELISVEDTGRTLNTCGAGMGPAK